LSLLHKSQNCPSTGSGRTEHVLKSLNFLPFMLSLSKHKRHLCNRLLFARKNFWLFRKKVEALLLKHYNLWNLLTLITAVFICAVSIKDLRCIKPVLLTNLGHHGYAKSLQTLNWYDFDNCHVCKYSYFIRNLAVKDYASTFSRKNQTF
jgi:hypothetical protein